MLIRRNRHLSRRTLLRGMGTAVALPMLDAMIPAAKASQPAVSPKRLQIFYTPNGVIIPNYTPKTVGENFELSPILKPLEPFRDRIAVITGMANNQPNAYGGGGGHGSACGLWLTGVFPKPTEGFDISCGISMDQVVANQIGQNSQFGSLELGIEPPSLVGSCDAGFSCAYTNTVSWRSPTAPSPVTVNPRELFESLFGDGDSLDAASRRAQALRQASLLDFVREDFSRVSGTIGADDKRKVDQYLDSIRDVERRIQLVERQNLSLPDLQRPIGIPESFKDHVHLMVDLQIVALQADLTRVLSFMIAREVSMRSYPEIGVNDGHHYISHHGNEPKKMADVTKINVLHMEQFAYYLDRMIATKEGDGCLLDNTLVLQGACMGDPNSHDRGNIGAVTVNLTKGNRHIALPKGTPYSNLLLSAMHTMGVNQEKFGNSTGVLNELNA